MNTHDISSFERLKKFSKTVHKEGSKVFLLGGDLGAGKTTFVSTFIRENLTSSSENFDDLGVMSPTFSLVNQYQTQSSFIVHADMYRIKEGDFEEEDLLELIEQADYSFIEWPSNLKSLDFVTRAFKPLKLEFRLSSDQKERSVLFTKL